MTHKLGKGDKVRFLAFSLLGDRYEMSGVVEGDEKELRKRYPEEAGGAQNCYLIKARDVFGNIQRHLVFPEDIIEKKEDK